MQPHGFENTNTAIASTHAVPDGSIYYKITGYLSNAFWTLNNVECA
jgi:hypothetical protein